MKKILFPYALVLLVVTSLLFSLSVMAATIKEPETVTPTIFKLNELILTAPCKSKADLIEDKIKKHPDDKYLLELKLDMLYGTDLFSYLWTPEDYKNSFLTLERLKKAKYNLPKMYLYEALYYKNLGNWDIALNLVEQSLKESEKGNLKDTDKLYFHSRAMFEKGIFDADQSKIVSAIEELEVVLSNKPDNIIFLSTINEMMRYIDVPEDLFESFQERAAIYENKLKKIQDQLTLKNPQNVLNKKIERDNLYYETVMKPISEEILRRWKQASSVQRSSADLLFIFQVTKDREIINVTLISEDDASESLINVSKMAIENTIVPYLPEDYPLKTMNILFIFSYE